MEPKTVKKLMFNDGYVYSADLILLASQLRELANHDDSRISQIIKGKWKYRDFELDATVSVAASAATQQGFFMGRKGNILVAAAAYTTESIADASRHGELIRIRNVDDDIYIVGMKGQVYKRRDSNWIHIDDGILGDKQLHLEDIGGTAPDDLYVVGPYGDVLHYDGSGWTRLDFPTNRPLSGVKAVSADEVYVCGNDGNLFKGNTSGWQYIGDPDFDSHFWAVESYNGKIYAAHGAGILAYDGTSLEPVDFGVDRAVDCHRLHANDGVLWSFGIDDLFYFDGSKWEEVVCPMNL